MDDILTGDITCPHCRQNSPFVYHPFVDSVDHPDLKAQCMTGEIFAFTCQHCGKRARIGYPLVYHDGAARTLILAFPERDIAEARKLLEALADKGNVDLAGYSLRVAAQPPILAEKIFLLDQGLDDRIIELYKRALTPAVKMDWGNRPIRLAMLTDHEGMHFLFFLEDHPLPVILPFERETYETMRGQYAPFFPTGTDANLFVDQQWAEDFMHPGGVIQ